MLDQFGTLDEKLKLIVPNFEDTMHHPDCIKSSHKSQRMDLTVRHTKKINDGKSE